MGKVLRYILAYSMWFTDLGLSIWLFYISRMTLLGILAFFYQQGDFQYSNVVDLVDRIFVVVGGLGWLVFSVVTEEYYRTGTLKENFLKRFARVTGPLLLCIFIVDLVLIWVQSIGIEGWLRWLILAAELVIGLALVVYGKKNTTNNPN